MSEEYKHRSPVYLWLNSTDAEVLFYGRCYSYVGRLGNGQTLSLSRQGCIYHNTVQHELLHALGFKHEQCRSDRDQYIRVLLQNVQSGMGSPKVLNPFLVIQLSIQFIFSSFHFILTRPRVCVWQDCHLEPGHPVWLQLCDAIPQVSPASVSIVIFTFWSKAYFSSIGISSRYKMPWWYIEEDTKSLLPPVLTSNQRCDGFQVCLL